MISRYTFEETSRLSDQYPVPALRIHAAAGCGNAFHDIGAILEPENQNPCLLLNNPLGLTGVITLVSEFYKRNVKEGSDGNATGSDH